MNNIFSIYTMSSIRPFTSKLTPGLLANVDEKMTAQITSLLRGCGPPYTPRDVAIIRRITLMRWNATYQSSDAQIFFIFTLTEHLIADHRIARPLDIIERAITNISGVNQENVEELTELWLTNPDQAAAAQAAQAAAQIAPLLNPTKTPAHDRWIQECTTALDRVIMSLPIKASIASAASSSSASASASSASVSITDLERKISELEKKLKFSKNPAEKMVYPRQIEELRKQLLLLKQKQGGKKYKKKQTIKKSRSRSRSKSKNYKSKSKKSISNKKYSIKRNQKRVGGGRLPVFQHLAQGQSISQDADPDFWRRRSNK